MEHAGIAALADVTSAHLQGQIPIAAAVPPAAVPTLEDFQAAEEEKRQRWALKRVHGDDVLDLEVTAGVVRSERVKCARLGEPYIANDVMAVVQQLQASVQGLQQLLQASVQGLQQGQDTILAAQDTMAEHAMAVRVNARALSTQAEWEAPLQPIPQLRRNAPAPALGFGAVPAVFPAHASAARQMQGPAIELLAQAYGSTFGVDLADALLPAKQEALLQFLQGLRR